MTNWLISWPMACSADNEADRVAQIKKVLQLLLEICGFKVLKSQVKTHIRKQNDASRQNDNKKW